MTNKLKLDKIGEKEYRIGDHRFEILNNSILYIEANGDQPDEFAEVVRNSYLTMYSHFSGKISHLINLNNSGKSSPESRKFYQEMNIHERTEKVAVFGMHPVAKVLASFVIGVTMKKNVRFFFTKEEALRWLSENQ